MKGVVFYFFVTVAFVQSVPREFASKKHEAKKRCVFCCAGGNDNALDNILKNNKPVFADASSECRTVMATNRTFRNENITQYIPSEACDISLSQRRPKTRLYVHEIGQTYRDYRECGTGAPRDRAYFLPQDDNKSTYMILDHSRAHWLFTNDLSGCDIYVATNGAGSHLVIHANLNSCAGDPITNLRVKGENADQIIRDFAPGYTLRARLHRRPDPRIDISGYIAEYTAAHPNVRMYSYSAFDNPVQGYNFVGNYNSDWEYFKKGQQDGAKTVISLT